MGQWLLNLNMEFLPYEKKSFLNINHMSTTNYKKSAKIVQNANK